MGEEASIFDVAFGYAIPAVIFVVFYLFLNKRFSSEESSETGY